LADCTELIPSSIALTQARADALGTAQALREFVAEHQQHAARLAQVEETLSDVKATLQQIIGDFCDYFAELKADREAERQRIAADEASRAELNAAMDALPLGAAPDPLDGPRHEFDDQEPVGEDARGALPEPSLEPDLRESDPGTYPDNRRPDTHDPLNEAPSIGTMPVWNIRDLKHRQPVPPTQAAFGGS
jgi:hypothetical protein